LIEERQMRLLLGAAVVIVLTAGTVWAQQRT